MIDAITYADMLAHIEKNGLISDTIGLLLTRPDLHTGKDILKSLDYFHHLTGHSINFYLPGYGAYWSKQEYSDMTTVTQIDGVDWSFSYKAFVEFVEALEDFSKWKYSGESELLLIPYIYGSLDYSNVGMFHLDAMLNDGTISSVSSFMTAMSRSAKRNIQLKSIVAKGAARVVTKAVVEEIIDSLPKHIAKPIKRGKHYICRNFSK